MQLLFPSSHWLFRVLQHFHGSYLKYSFFLAQRTEKRNLFSEHHSTDFDAVCHPSPMASSRCRPPPANNKNYPSETSVLHGSAVGKFCKLRKQLQHGRLLSRKSVPGKNTTNQTCKFWFRSETVCKSLSRILLLFPRRCCAFCFLCGEELRITTACFLPQ